jgi:hypothetical protein
MLPGGRPALTSHRPGNQVAVREECIMRVSVTGATAEITADLA